MATVNQAQNVLDYAKEIKDTLGARWALEVHIETAAKNLAEYSTVDYVSGVTTHHFPDESKIILTQLNDGVDIEVVA